MHSDPPAFVASFLVLAVFVALGVAVAVRHWRGLPRVGDAAEEQESEAPPVSIAPPALPQMLPPPMVDPRQRCVCGELATEPAPILVRERGSVIRDLLSMPPRYRRVVPRASPPIYCPSHAHVADAKLAEFVSASVRSAFSSAYAAVAVAAAAFEQEDLPRLVADSLTDAQKKAVKRAQLQASPLRAIGRTGTDDATAEPPAAT